MKDAETLLELLKHAERVSVVLPDQVLVLSPAFHKLLIAVMEEHVGVHGA